jgi:hypothetical protein
MKNSDFPFGLEALEARIAPASMLSFTDVDGDQVTIKATKGNLAGHATFSDSGSGQQLEILDLTDNSFAGTNLTITVKKVAGGDGFANLGFLNAAGNDLGKVSVKGDLGKIDAGDGNDTFPAIKSLTVHSMGTLGTTTQGGIIGGTLPPTVVDLITDLTGDGVGTLKDVQSNVADLLGGDIANLPASVLRSLTNLNSTLESLLSNESTGLLPNVSTLLGNISHEVNNLLGTANLGDVVGTGLADLLNQAGTSVDQVLTQLPSTADVNVEVSDLLGLDLNGLLNLDLGGLFSNAGDLVQNLGDTVGDLLGRSDLGQLPASLQGLLGQVNGILQPILAGTAPITSDVINILSQLENGLASALGQNGSGDSLDGVSQATSDLLDTLDNSVNEVLGGSTNAADPDFDLTSNIDGSVGMFKITTDASEVFLNIDGSVRSLAIGGTLIGDQFQNGGNIFVSGDVHSLKIGKDVLGGGEVNTGDITVQGAVNALKIGGSLIGGAGSHSGALAFGSDVHSLTIGRNITGQTGVNSGSVFGDDGGVGKISIRGSIVSGDADDAGTLRFANAIGGLRIGGNIVGDADHRVDISAGGLENKVNNTDIAIGNTSVNGSVSFADILAGYDTSLAPVNGDAQIAKVAVRGNWVASNLVAGIDSPGAPSDFGDTDNTTIATDNTETIIASIASIQIRGSVFGTVDAGDHFGFVAEQIGSAKIGTAKAPLNKGPNNDVVELAQQTGDVTIREVGTQV